MEFLIKTIIKRMEDMASKGNEVFTTERKSVALDPESIPNKQQQKERKILVDVVKIEFISFKI